MPILRIRDENRKFIPINAIKGDDGKSAYELAQEGGYKGTLEDFIAILNGLTSTEDANHYANFNNPHLVTAEQVGAIPKWYYESSDLNNEISQGGAKMTVCCYNNLTLNTPYKENITPYTHGMVITNSYDVFYGTQMCLPSGEDAVYVRRLDGNGISEWLRLADDNQIRTLQAEIALVSQEVARIEIGSYEGSSTNQHGSKNPLTLTFPFVPKVVFICPNKKTSSVPFAWIYGSPVGLTAYNNGVAYASNLTWEGNTLTWYTTDGYPSYQHNAANTTYYWVAIG